MTAVVLEHNASPRSLGVQIAAGSVLAAGATAAGVAAAGALGALPATIGIVLAAPVYAVGHLAILAHRHRRAKTASGARNDFDAPTLASLDAMIAETRQRVPPTVQ